MIRFALVLILFTMLASLAANAATATEKQTLVLVHGATAGGWLWKRTGKFLTDGRGREEGSA